MKKEFLADVFVTAWRKYLRVNRNLSESTIKSYTDSVANTCREFSMKPIELLDIDLARARDIVAELRSDGLSPRSINTRVSALRSWFYFFHKPCPFVDRSLRFAHTVRPYIPHDALLVALSKCTDPIARMVLGIFVYTGIRADEASQMKYCDIDMEFSTMLVHGKGRRERILPICPELMSILQEYLELWRSYLTVDPSLPLFFSYNGGGKPVPLTSHSLRNILLANFANELTPQLCHPHIIRHSVATYLLRRGYNLTAVSRWLGHNSVKSTEIYLHYTCEDLRDLVEP